MDKCFQKDKCFLNCCKETDRATFLFDSRYFVSFGKGESEETSIVCLRARLPERVTKWNNACVSIIVVRRENNSSWYYVSCSGKMPLRELGHTDIHEGRLTDSLTLISFCRGRRPGGLSAWTQGRHANTWLVALSTPRGPTLSGTVCPSPLTPGGPVWALRGKFRGLV